LPADAESHNRRKPSMGFDPAKRPVHVAPAPPNPLPDDAALARALVAGESWATCVAWNRYAPLVYGIARRALRHDDDAQDATQEILSRFFARVGTLRQPEALRSFISSFAFRIVKWELR